MVSLNGRTGLKSYSFTASRLRISDRFALKEIKRAGPEALPFKRLFSYISLLTNSMASIISG